MLDEAHPDHTSLPERSETGQFVKGQSGNPNGRPKGRKNEITLLRESLELALREQGAPHMGEVLNTAIALAKEGDRTMIKLLLELHMSKTAPEGGGGQEKVTINISGPTEDAREVIDVTPNEGDSSC